MFNKTYHTSPKFGGRLRRAAMSASPWYQTWWINSGFRKHWYSPRLRRSDRKYWVL